MRKSFVLLCIFVCWLSLCTPCYADNPTEVSSSEFFEPQSEVEETVPLEVTQTEDGDTQAEPKRIRSEIIGDTGMVYISGEELESVWAALMSDEFLLKSELDKYDAHIVKESITPIYYIYLEELRKEKQIVLHPNYYGDNGDNQKRYYIAKTVYNDGKYPGSFIFYVKEGVAKFCAGSILYDKDNRKTSRWGVASYADFAERLRELLGAETVIPPSDVRLVGLYSPSIDDFSWNFYIHNENYQVIFNCGKYGLMDMKQLEELADWCEEEHKRFLRVKAQWEKEHPGKTYYPGAGATSADAFFENRTVRRIEKEIDNITDIASYLNIDYSINWDSRVTLGADLKPIKEQSKAFLPFLFAGVGGLLVSGAVVFFVLNKKRKRAQSTGT